jgi:hypothetical protein
VGLSAGLDTVSKRKISSPHRESNPDHPIVQPDLPMSSLGSHVEFSTQSDVPMLGHECVEPFFCIHCTPLTYPGLVPPTFKTSGMILKSVLFLK